MKKLIIWGVALVVAVMIFLAINPFAWNEAGSRTVITQAGGSQWVRFESGTYFAGFFSKKTEWPNQISVSYKDSIVDYDLIDNTIEIGKVNVRFNDATTASASGITQYVLPTSEKEMIELNNTHRTPEALVKRRLAPYTQECLQSSSQLLSSEMHYSGGRAQMTQDYLDQLKNGAFLLRVATINTYDSIEKTKKTLYEVKIQYDASGQPKRKFSSIKEYGITVGDAQITDVDYEPKVDEMLAKKIDAATKASISKQELMTAQQQQLTAEAQGKKKLVETEYLKRIDQTSQVVAAETQVQLAQKDLERQSIMLTAAGKEAAKIKVLADANAYEKERSIRADGALDKKLSAWLESQKYWADAFGKFNGNIVPLWTSGSTGGSGNAFATQMDFMNLKAAKDLALDMSNKK